MTLCDITFTNTLFANEVNPGGLEMGDFEAVGFTETCLAEGLFPKGVVAVVRGNISDDGDSGDSDGDYKYTASVTLRMEVDSADAARNVDGPELLLSRIVDAVSGDFSGDLEETWDVDDVEEVDPAAPADA
jgi:hypothetical protein